MTQEILALLVVAFFLVKLFWQKKKNVVQKNEFVFWFAFWILAILVIVFLKQIDNLVSQLGFTGSGIQLVFYLAVVLLFYLVFKIRLRLAKIDRNLTKLAEDRALRNFENKKNK